MRSFEEIGESAGAFAGGCFGAVGYTAGPFVGTVLTAGGGTTGYFLGKSVGWLIDVVSDHNQRVKQIEVESKKVIENANETVKSFDFTVGNIGKSVSIINGCGVLAIGVALGVGLHFSRAECNPQCVDTLAETIRLSALALTVSGVGIVGFTGIRSLFAY